MKGFTARDWGAVLAGGVHAKKRLDTSEAADTIVCATQLRQQLVDRLAGAIF